MLVLACGACNDDEPQAASSADAAVPRDREDATEVGPSRDGGRRDAGLGAAPIIEVDCPIGTEVEYEPNDAPARANVLEGLSFCGAISPGADVDHSTFTTPAGKKLTLFQAVVDGAVAIALTVDGQTFGPEDVGRFVAGTYRVRISTTDGRPGKYRYRIQTEP